MEQFSPNGTEAGRDRRAAGLSYKFQRLRERLREAIASGDLAGKLPGERSLARRFHVNAKTLSKALTDLAAEGVLERSIGRGTYVKGSAEAGQTEECWLVLCNTNETDSALVRELMRLRPESKPVSGTTELRPSFLSKFTAVVDVASDTPERFRRDMIVRGVPVVLAAEQESTYSHHAVRFDQALAAFCLTRDLLMSGHRRVAAIDIRGSTAIVDAMRRAANRYAPEATVDSGFEQDVMAMVEHGITAVVCQARETMTIRQALEAGGINVPQQVSLAALGSAEAQPACSGYYLEAATKAAAIRELVREVQPHRPSVVWLTGQYIERRTTESPEGGQCEREMKLPAALAS